MENFALYFYLGGAVVGLLGLVWLWVVAFRQRFAWGLGIILFPPLMLIFVPKHFRQAWRPAAVMVLACVLLATPMTAVWLFPEKIDLGEREKNVNGEIHLTLTGWDRKNYNLLKQKTHIAVLQMANADVTDATLENLRGMDKLYKLDLGNSQVTDAGLKVLQDLPKLRELYLNGTKVTDAGLKEHLAAIATLERLDLRNTAVTEEAAKEWRKGNPKRLYMLK
jgi:hypothetical protein